MQKIDKQRKINIMGKMVLQDLHVLGSVMFREMKDLKAREYESRKRNQQNSLNRP